MASAVTATIYDGSDRALTQKDPDGNTTTFIRRQGGSSAGQTEVTGPSGHATLCAYANGRPALVVEATGDTGVLDLTSSTIRLGGPAARAS